MDAEQASSLAWHLMIEHDLVRNGWQFRWTNSHVVFGACSHSHRLIKLSLPITLLNPESEVSDTILHEIAHALAGHDAGHGDAWKEQAIALGAKPDRCYDTAKISTPPARYTAICETCKTVKTRHRKPSPTLSCACGTCCKRYNHGKYDPRFILKFVRNENSS